ncbi:MAG: hypothetical protein Aurels2KO_32360 [Aureliella sp.]
MKRKKPFAPTKTVLTQFPNREGQFSRGLTVPSCRLGPQQERRHLLEDHLLEDRPQLGHLLERRPLERHR